MANSYSDRRDKSRSPAYEGLEVANPNDGRPFNFATDDGLQVLPHEFVVDKKQGLLHATSNEGKEVVPLDSSNSAPEFLENRSTADSSKPYRKRRRPLSLLIILSTIGITILVAAIVPAVVVTQKHKSETSSSTSSSPNTTPISSGTNLTASYFSTSGAFNGTGMATMDPRNGADGTWLVYQDYTGDIKYTRYSLSGAWQGSQSLGIKDALNATSLGAISYYAPGTTLYRVFYIDNSGTIKDMIMTNITSTWQLGNIGNYNFQAPPKPGVALSAWLDTETFGINQTGPGLRLYVGGNDGLVHEYGFDQTTDFWAAGYAFPATNGYAGVGTEAAGALTSLHVLNADNNLELWWRDWGIGDNSFPSGSWHRGADSSSLIRINSSVSTCFGEGSAYYQDPTLSISGLPWTGDGAAEVWNSSFSIPDAQGIAATAITCSASSATIMGTYFIHIYFQGNGSNILEYGRQGSTWSLLNHVPVG